MHNVSHQITGNKLTIEVDLTPATMSAAPMSSTGKTKLVASTSGAVSLPPVEGKPVSFSLNVMCKA
jgi:hypothetical protein